MSTRHRGFSGFTLIELLVVIAIIGLLASIVVAFLNDARKRAHDTSFNSSVASLRDSIENYYTPDLSYINMCQSDSLVMQHFERINESFGYGDVQGVDYGCILIDYDNYVFYMKTAPGEYACFDSSDPQFNISKIFSDGAPDGFCAGQ